MLKRQHISCTELPVMYNKTSHTKWIYNSILSQTKANGIPHASKTCKVNPGVLFVPGDEEFGNFFPGMFVSGKEMILPMKNNSDVEVMHFKRSFRRGYQSHAALENQFWYYHAPGSNIFLPMGTILWKVVHNYNYISCNWAREHNYDTIVYQPYQSKETGISRGNLIEIVDCRGMSNATWLGTCPGREQIKYLMNPKRESCKCNNTRTYLTC